MFYLYSYFCLGWFPTRRNVGPLRWQGSRHTRGCHLRMIRSRGWLFLTPSSMKYFVWLISIANVSMLSGLVGEMLNVFLGYWGFNPAIDTACLAGCPRRSDGIIMIPSRSDQIGPMLSFMFKLYAVFCCLPACDYVYAGLQKSKNLFRSTFDLWKSDHNLISTNKVIIRIYSRQQCRLNLFIYLGEPVLGCNAFMVLHCRLKWSIVYWFPNDVSDNNVFAKLNNLCAQ